MEKSLNYMFLKIRLLLKFSAVLLSIAFLGTAKAHCQEMDGASVDTLTKPQIESFREQAIKSVNDLEKFIQAIVNKKNDMPTRNRAIDLAVDLFQSDTNTVQVSSIKSDSIRTYFIPIYLTKLKLLPYNTIKIQWYKIYLGNRFTLGPDGNYYGTATFLQRFEGIGNNEMGSYKDITKRHIQIILKRMDVYKGANKINEYKLKLGDIRVEATKRG